MKYFIALIVIVFLTSCASHPRRSAKEAMLQKTEEAWKKSRETRTTGAITNSGHF